MGYYEKISTLKEEKFQAKRKAKQLGYIGKFPDITERIDAAETKTEIYNILTDARRAM